MAVLPARQTLVLVSFLVLTIPGMALGYDVGADLYPDGKTDLNDFSVLSENWQLTMGMEQLSLLADHWLTPPFLVINEIMYHPQDDNHDHEFLELYNYGNDSLDISGWVLEQAVNLIFPPGTIIPPHEYLVVCRNEAAVQSYYGITNTVGNYFDDKLSNGGENIVLKTSAGVVIDEVNYSDGSHPVGDDPWPQAPDGFGPSLELFLPASDNAVAANWGVGQPFTPGSANNPTDIVGGDIVINEIMYKPQREEFREKWDRVNSGTYYEEGDDEFGEYVELFNRGTVAVDMSNWRFTDGIDYTFPPGTILEPNHYLVVAANPNAMLQRFGINALGPFGLALNDGGERITLSDATGNLVVDTVRYDDKHPWPIGPDEFGYSLECVNPWADNTSAANWRSCQSEFQTEIITITLDDTWLYDASGNDLGTAWRDPNYNDSLWLVGDGLIGYETGAVPSPGIATWLSDPQEGGPFVTTYYFRKHLTLNAAPVVTGSLELGTVIDDGAIIYINGEMVQSIRMPAGPIDYLTLFPPGIEPSYESFTISTEHFVQGDNVIAVEVHQSTVGSSDVLFGLELFMAGSDPAPPIGGFLGKGTPGGTNSVLSANVAPLVADLAHSPLKPSSTDDVTVTARVQDDDPLSSVQLEVLLNTSTSGTFLAMNDNGTNGDAIAGDGVYSVVVPAKASQTLVHYRVHAQDNQGSSTAFPYDDDPSPTEAYFHYDNDISTNYELYQMFITAGNIAVLDAEPQVSKLYVDCSLVIDHIAYPHIGTRYRGRGSRKTWPHPWKFRFNKNKLYNNNRIIDTMYSAPEQQKASFDAFDVVRIENLENEVISLYINGGFRANYIGFESPGSSWLDKHNYDPNGEIYKSRACETSTVGKVLNSDLFHNNLVTDMDFWGSYNKKVRPLEPPDHIRDLVDNLNDLSDTDLLDWLEANVDLDQWLKRWAVHICFTLSDFCCHNNYLFRPSEPGGKWRMLGYDYDQLGWYLPMRPFYGDGLTAPNNPDWMINKFYQRVSLNPTLSRIYLLILQDIVDNYNFVSMIPNMPSGVQSVVTSQTNWLRNTSLPSYGLPGHDKTPVISPLEGVYNESVTVTLSTSSGWYAWYTLDGTDPRLSPTRQAYSSSLLLNESTIIRVAAHQGAGSLSDGKWSRLARANIEITPPVVINEVLAHSHAGEPDWIELRNTTGSPVNIAGWFLSDRGDTDADLKKYEIGNVTIPANGYVVFYEDQHFGNPSDPGSHTTFALSENGETVYLSSGFAGGLTNNLRQWEDFGASQTDVAFGRYFNAGTGKFNFVAMNTNTPGNPNVNPKIWEVVINEILYNPPEPAPASSFTNNDDFEYIEIVNRTGSAVNLYDLEGNPWRFTNGINFTFPLSTTIPANGYLLVVKNPAAFAERYPGVSPSIIFGPFEDDMNLSNNGEKLDLSIPGDLNNSGERQYIRIDRVDYSDGSNNDWPDGFPNGVDPWPTQADGPNGNGSSLHRMVPDAYGNDVTNWNATTPTPGA